LPRCRRCWWRARSCPCRGGRQDHEIGGLQAAHLGVEVAQARGDARQFAVALEGFGRHVDGDRERLRKALEAAIVTAGLGEFVELAFGILDLRARGKIDRRVEGDVDHVLADPDQIAAQRKFVDGSPIILGIDDGGRFGGEASEVLADRHTADVGFGRDKGLQRHRGRDLAHPDQAAGGLEDGLMDRLEEVFRLQKIRHPIERVVIDQDRAQKALLRLDIVRCAPIGRSCQVGSEPENVRISQGHGYGLFFRAVKCGARTERHSKEKRIASYAIRADRPNSGVQARERSDAIFAI
jgi:hypothetical protein